MLSSSMWEPNSGGKNGSSPFAITGLESPPSTRSASSRSSSACPAGKSTPAPGSAWRSARRSWNGTEGGSGWNRGPEKEARSSLHSQARIGNHHDQGKRNGKADRDLACGGQSLRRGSGARGAGKRQD